VKIGADEAHLTYCSNIHPGESWAEVRANIERYFPAVRDRIAPEALFGIGLRLSARAARELGEGNALAEFREFMDRNKLYVFTINGFPYGVFHGTRVKEEVYLPDWRDEERLRYTDELAELLVQLLPEGVDGSISTVPGAFKPAMGGEADVETIADNMLRHVAKLVEIKQRSGRSIALALEPEPYCFLETIDESVRFFQQHLFSADAVSRLSELTGLDDKAAAAALSEHIGLCLDLCHAAVEFEDAAGCIAELQEAGIRVTKMQISAGLRLPELTPNAVAALKQFDDAVYLHQVVEHGPGGVKRYVDLPEALATATGDADGREWRVHCHVPIFMDDLGEFSSTRAFISEVLDIHKRHPVSAHLEVETYTWNVLPDHLRTGGMEHAIARELRWVMDTLAAKD
jgi:sugar phosphate isomerase/epimerase